MHDPTPPSWEIDVSLTCRNCRSVIRSISNRSFSAADFSGLTEALTRAMSEHKNRCNSFRKPAPLEVRRPHTPIG